MDIKQYEKYLIEDEPIPYSTSSMIKKREIISSEIFQLSQKENLSEEELEHIKQLQEEFENKKLLIYPVTAHDYMDFNISVSCLMIDKNKIPDPKVISMSYLDFLFSLMISDTQEGQFYKYAFMSIFELCLKIDSHDIAYKKDDKGKIELIIGNTIINRNDFDEIKEIICNQNIISYDDSYIDPELAEALQEAEEFENKHKKKMGSFEDQVICVMIALNEADKKKILNLTIRTFSKILQRYDFKLHYIIAKTASVSGMVEMKGEIDHWMSDLSKQDKFAGKIINFNELEEKINSANG